MQEQLENYIRDELSKGRSVDNVKSQCLAAGWAREEVDKVVKSLSPERESPGGGKSPPSENIDKQARGKVGSEVDKSQKSQGGKRWFNLSFFKHLKTWEKIIYVILSLIALGLVIYLLAALVMMIRAGEGGLGALDMIFLAIVLAPAWLASKLRLRGIKRAKEAGEVVNEEWEKSMEDISQNFGGTIKWFAITGAVGLVMMLIALGIYMWFVM
jgi:hypothetical protein